MNPNSLNQYSAVNSQNTYPQMYGNALTASSVASISPMLESRAALISATDELRKHIEELEMILSTVLRPSAPSPNGGIDMPNAPAASDLRGFIDAQRGSVRSTISRLQDIMARLDL